MGNGLFQSGRAGSHVTVNWDVVPRLPLAVVIFGGVRQPPEQVAALIIVKMLVQITLISLHSSAIGDMTTYRRFFKMSRVAQVIPEIGFQHIAYSPHCRLDFSG